MSSLEEQAIARKQKLIALAKRKATSSSSSDINRSLQSTTSEILQDSSVIVPIDGRTKRAKQQEFRFRNYDPIIQGPKRHDSNLQTETVESTVKDVMERVKIEDEIRRSGELDLTKIQPKKPNWDLKRDLLKKTSKLDPITQAAFATLIRRRMQAEGATSTEEGTAALVTEMNTAGQLVDQLSDDDQSSDPDT